METSLDYSLGDVRIHDDAAADHAARAVQAHAFTLGNDVVFRAGRYDAASAGGRHLLAHELAHVVQQGGRTNRLQRQHDGTGAGMSLADAPVCEAGPDTERATAPHAPDANNQLDFDPCDVDVPSLTNEALLLQIGRALDFLHSHEKGPDYYAFANLMRRLSGERQVRMRAGHVWLGDSVGSTPSALYRLAPGPYGTIEVSLAEVTDMAGSPAPLDGATSIVTPSQFQAFLAGQGIPTVDAETYFAAQPLASMAPLHVLPPPPREPLSSASLSPTLASLGSGDAADLIPGSIGIGGPYASIGIGAGFGGISQFDVGIAPGVAPQVMTPGVDLNNPRSVTGARSHWRGALGEYGFGYGGMDFFGYRDLNRVQANFPIFDFQNRLTHNLISVKSVVPTDPNAAPNFSTYDRGFMDMIGARRPATLSSSAALLNSTTTDLVTSSYLAVNNDHVVAYRNRVEANLVTSPGEFAPLLNSFLGTRPVEIGGTTYRSWSTFDAAHSAGTVSDADYARVVRELAQRARGRVIGNGLTTAEFRNLMAFRETLPGVSQRDFSRLAAPELIEAERFGGGVAGTQAAITRSMLRGGGAGMVMAAGFDLGAYWYDPERHPLDTRRFFTDVGLAGGGGMVASGIESSIVISGSRAMLADAAAGAAPGIAAPLGSRMLGAGIGSAVAAPLVVMGSMALDADHDYTWIDYTAKGTRAFVAGAAAGTGGAAAGAGGAAAVGALVGSEVPIVGTIIGAGVGLLIYWLVDESVGDDMEQAVRLAAGEGGCPRSTPESLEPSVDDSE